MLFPTSRSVLIFTLLCAAALAGIVTYSAKLQINSHAFIPPITLIMVVVLFFLLCLFLIYRYLVREKSDALTLRFPVVFCAVLWVLCFGVSLESWIGTHLWQQNVARAVQVETAYIGGVKNAFYSDKITYQYVFQGNTYTGQEQLDNTDRTVNKPLHGNERLNIGQILTGEELYIRVNPLHPEQSFIQPRIRIIPFLLFFISTILLGKWTLQKSLTKK